MINKKSIIILASVLVVMVGAFLAVNYLWTEEQPPAPDSSTESIEVFSTAKENIVAIDLKVNGESFGFLKKDDKWVLKGDEAVKLKNSAVDYLSIDLAGVYARMCVEEDVKDIAKYGLDEPLGQYVLTLKDGTSKTFAVGRKDPVSGSYYFKDDDSTAVYAVYESKGNSLLKPLAQYRDSSILEVDTQALSTIYMKKGATILNLKKSVIETEQGAQNIEWNMTSPMNRACDAEPVSDNIISKISYITVQEFIDGSDARYSASGVSNPEATITLTDDNGVSQTIYVGKADGQSRYIKTNGRVYLINGDSVSFMDVEPFIYISKFICIENIDTVSKIEVTHDDKVHVVTIDGEGDNQVYKLNGKEVLEDTFKRQVYQKIIGLLADDFAKSPVYAKPEYTVTYYLKDGTVKKNDYCYYDDRSYAAFDGNGKCEFIIRHKKLEEMFASIEDVAAGRVTE